MKRGKLLSASLVVVSLILIAGVLLALRFTVRNSSDTSAQVSSAPRAAGSCGRRHAHRGTCRTRPESAPCPCRPGNMSR